MMYAYDVIAYSYQVYVVRIILTLNRKNLNPTGGGSLEKWYLSMNTKVYARCVLRDITYGTYT